jgi:hypothetical protein
MAGRAKAGADLALNLVANLIAIRALGVRGYKESKMKLGKNTLMAALVAAGISIGMPAAAGAQGMQHMETHREVRTTVVHPVANRGHGWTQRRVCTVRVDHHRRVRTCRMVRVRR